MLRCKKGDLAIVIKSYSGGLGLVVVVGEYLGKKIVDGGVLMNAWSTFHPRDKIGIEYISDDADLLPIRPDELKEEEEKERELVE